MSDPTDWMDRAKCGGVGDFTEWPARSREILCQACPVVDACRAWGGKPALPRRTTPAVRDARRKRYCVHGHDTHLTGRDARGSCLGCHRDRNRDRKRRTTIDAEHIAQLIDASSLTIIDISRASGVPYETVRRLHHRITRRVNVASAQAITEALTGRKAA